MRCRRDQQIYEQRIGADGASEPKRITDPDAKLRFADGRVDAGRGRLIVVQEDHSGEGEAVNTVAAVGEWHWFCRLTCLLHLLPACNLKPGA